MVSGGIHLRAFASCLVTTLISITTLVYLVNYIAVIVSPIVLLFLVVITSAAAFNLIAYRVPVSSKNREINSIKEKQFFKKASNILVSIFASISLVLISLSLSPIFILSILAGVNLQLFILMPQGERLFSILDRVVSYRRIKSFKIF